MQRFRFSLLAAAGILVLAFVLTAIGPKRVMAALGYTPVRDVDQPARQPVAIYLSATAGPGQFGASASSLPVPAGKRLVIETISCSITLPAGQTGEINFDVTSGGQSIIYRPPMTLNLVDADGGQHVRALENVRIYADPGTRLAFTELRSGSTSFAGAAFAASGYLVDLP